MSKALTKRSEPSLFLIAPTVPAKFRRDLWGALIRKPYQPTAAFSTEDAAKKPIELVAKLEPEEAIITNYHQVLERCSQVDVRSKLQGVFSAFWSSDSSKGHTHSSTRAEFWNMTAPQKRLDELMAIESYRADAEKFLQEAITKGDDIFFVTAMLTLADMEHEQHDTSNKAGGASAVLRDPNTGTEVAEVGVGGGKGTGTSVGATYEGTRIVCVGYHRVTYEKVKGLQSLKRKLFGGPRHEIQTVVKIGDGTLYKLSAADDMEEGGVPTLGVEDEDVMASAEEDGHDAAASFQIYSSYRVQEAEESSNGAAVGH